MKKWIKDGIEEAKQREAKTTQAQDWQRQKADKLLRESWPFWEKIRAVLSADAQEIENAHSIKLTTSKPNANPGPESILVERSVYPQLGFTLSFDQEAKAMVLQYHFINKGSREDRGVALKFGIDVDDASGELCIISQRSNSAQNFTTDEFSEGLLHPLLLGDLRGVSRLLGSQ